MKKNTLLALSVAVGTALTAASSFGSTQMMNLVTPALGSAAPIYTISVSTPNNTEIRLDEVRFFIGSTCNTLMNVEDFYSQGDEYASAISGQGSLSSKDLIEMVGPGMGCFKADAFYQGKLHTTGPVALTWDSNSHQYTAATPSSVHLSF